jgi:hypothetical protein
MDKKELKLIIENDSKTSAGLAKEYTEICLMLLNKLIEASKLTGFFTTSIYNVIINYLSKDSEWFIRLTSTFFIEYSEPIIAQDLKFFIDYDYKSQMNDWVPIFGGAVANGIKNIITSGIKNVNNDRDARDYLHYCMISVLRKSALYATLYAKTK